MKYIEDDKQWVYEYGESYIHGANMRVKIDKPFIEAGTVLVFSINNKPHLMFQTLAKIDFFKMGPSDLVGYEPGSLIFKTHSDYLPTLRFKNCRFPTEIEYNSYRKRKTV